MLRPLALLTLAACGRVGFEGAEPGPDAGVDAPDAAPAICAGLLCDEFEDPSLAQWTSSELVGVGFVEQDASFGRAGGSLHAFAETAADIMTRGANVVPPDAAALWVRLWMYVPSGFELDLEPLELTTPAHDYQIVFGIYESGFNIHAHDIADDFEVPGVTPAPVRDAWACYELGATIGAAGRVQLYVDGSLEAETASVDTRPAAAALTQVRIGIASKPPTLSQELWIDDVVIATARPGCD